MKIENMSMDLFHKLWNLWSAESLSDEMKGQDPFKYMLCESDDVPWYLVDNTVFVVYKLRPGWDAEMVTLNLHKVSREAGISEIGNILTEYELQRITLPIPHPVRRTARAAHRLGMKMEGRLHNATFYDGIFEDLDLFGAHRETFEGGGPPSKAVRSRRGPQKKKAAPEAEDVAGESQEKTAEVDAP